MLSYTYMRLQYGHMRHLNQCLCVLDHTQCERCTTLQPFFSVFYSMTCIKILLKNVYHSLGIYLFWIKTKTFGLRINMLLFKKNSIMQTELCVNSNETSAHPHHFEQHGIAHSQRQKRGYCTYVICFHGNRNLRLNYVHNQRHLPGS